MAEKHPYVAAPGGLEKTTSQLRKSFPAVVDSGTLKRFGFAPNNESYVLNVLRFLKIIDADNKKTDSAATVFSNHEDAAFSEAFSSVVRDAYSDLFDLYGDDAWNIEKEKLITYFRKSDQTSVTVGARQASTFQVLARLSGHGESPGAKIQKSKTSISPVSATDKRKAGATPTAPSATSEPTAASLPSTDVASPKVGLTVRIEINLPAVNDKDTYDKIFKSIRENLLNG